METYAKIIDQVVTNLKNEVLSQDVHEMDALCRYASFNISHDLFSLGIESVIEDISDLTHIPYSHNFIIVKSFEGPETYYLIDMTYSQFLPKQGQKLRFFDKWPAEALKENPQGQKLLTALLDKGYSQITDELFKQYLHSFDSKAEIFFTLEDLFFPLKENIKR